MAGLSAGTIVGGKYRLDAPIGRGGMASVWRATHTTLESAVAVKFLETFGSSRDHMAKRFLREAKLAGGLGHRNVVQILDYGVMDDGQPFMVMELLEGRSLADRFDHGPPMGDVELLELVAKVLGGLAAVHDAGIVHRDVKPDNVFIVRDSDGEYPKLLDFGISRGIAGEAGDTRVTRTGAVIGTPLYMSPEQARGMKDLDLRSDLWSTAMMLWEGLTGELPFESEHTGDVLIRVATEDAPSIATKRPDLPPEVVEILARALSRDRNGRYESAREMRDAVLAAADVLAADDGTTRRRRDPSSAALPVPAIPERTTGEIPPRRRARRWPLYAGAGVALLAAAITAFVAAGVRIRIEPETPSEPERAEAGPRETLPTSERDARDPRARPGAQERSAPAEIAPAEAAPADAAPAEIAPTDIAPVDIAPVDIAPADVAPAPPRSAEPALGSRRRPRETGAPSPQTEPAPSRSSRRSGGEFLRDLDY